MTLSDWLTAYLALGVLVTLLDFHKVAVERIMLTTFEQFFLFARITLAWPTYLVEDFLLWREARED